MLLIIFWITAFCLVDAQESCTHPNGKMAHRHAGWVGDDGCQVCECGQNGIQCQPLYGCSNSNHPMGPPGSPVCIYYVPSPVYYKQGQNWQTEDGCNNCTCTQDGTMKCTVHPCPNKGFATPIRESPDHDLEFMECVYGNLVYYLNDLFRTHDGCNTCFCVMPGNYATFPVCTTSPCGDPIGR